MFSAENQCAKYVVVGDNQDTEVIRPVDSLDTKLSVTDSLDARITRMLMLTTTFPRRQRIGKIGLFRMLICIREEEEVEERVKLEEEEEEEEEED